MPHLDGWAVRGLSVRDRILSSIDVHPDTGCWLYRGQLARDGYKRISVRHDGVLTRQPAHRVAYEVFIGPIPVGLTIDHVWNRGCRFRHCVNPLHLEPVTHRENILRGATRAAGNAQKDACPKCGGSYVVVPMSHRRQRRCVPCHRELVRQRGLRLKALGKCRSCGLNARPTQVYCEACAIIKRDMERKRRAS